ncbi:MAG: DUF4279 domain-containing protein [Planctomycetota bacterium]
MRNEPIVTGTTYASLDFYGLQLDPADVTRALLIPPDHEARAGTPRLSRGVRMQVIDRGTHPVGHWSMTTRDRVASLKLKPHLLWILRELEGKEEAVQELCRSGIQGKVSGLVLGPHAPVRAELPGTLRDEIRRLGLELDLEISY